MNDVVTAFRLPALKERTKSMNPAVQSVIPKYQKLNEARKQVSSDVQLLNKALGAQK